MNTPVPAIQWRTRPRVSVPRPGSARPASGLRQDVASDAFTGAMRGAATGVNIVTTDGPAGRFGLTVSAFASVSAEPPMVLVCINRRSPACTAVRANRVFCVNVLSATQGDVADRFAGRPATGEAYDFGAAGWTCSVSGSPILADSTASFDCVVESIVDAGTHAIFIGSVMAVDHTGKDALIYTRGAYCHTCSQA